MGTFGTWITGVWRGDLGVARSTLLLSGLGGFLLGTLADAGMEAGIAAGGAALLLFVVSAAFTIGFAALSLAAVWNAARREPGIGAGLAIAFAALQAALMLGDVGLSTLAACGLAPSPLDLLATLTGQAISPPAVP